MITKKVLKIFLSLLLMTGCATSQQPVTKNTLFDFLPCNTETECDALTLPSHHNGPPFTAHSNAGVRIPAITGGYLAGGLIGVPVSFVLLPITIPLTVNSKEPGPSFAVIAPAAWLWFTGGTVFGGMAWPFFGWW